MMQVKIQYRGMPESEALSEVVRDHADKLNTFFDRIINCEVVISSPHRHNTKGKIFHVDIHLSLPGPDIFINREPEKNEAHEDPYIAVRDAFEKAERKLRDFVQRRRGKVKHHEKSDTAASM